VVEEAIKLFILLAKEFKLNEKFQNLSSEHALNWFVKENGGLKMCIFCYSRHP
jgi:hypothetical protein